MSASSTQTYLLTGSAGFIGARTSELLLDEGHAVMGVDNLNDYYDLALKRYRLDRLLQRDNFTFIEGDIEDEAFTRSLFDNQTFDCVFNLAARAGVRASLETPHIYMNTNIIGTLNLLLSMRDKEVRKMVLASTSSLYACSPMPFTEDMPVNQPISPYAASKKAAEALTYTYHYLNDIDITVVRYFTVFGPAGRPDMAIFRFIKWIDEGKPLEIFGDGRQSRDFTYIDDIARGTVLARKELGYEVINLGGGNNPIELITVIEWLEEALGKKAKLEHLPFHKADFKSSYADISKAERLLGWEPEVSVREGVRRTVEWYKENISWLKEVRL